MHVCFFSSTRWLDQCCPSNPHAAVQPCRGHWLHLSGLRHVFYPLLVLPCAFTSPHMKLNKSQNTVTQAKLQPISAWRGQPAVRTGQHFCYALDPVRRLEDAVQALPVHLVNWVLETSQQALRLGLDLEQRVDTNSKIEQISPEWDVKGQTTVEITQSMWKLLPLFMVRTFQ